jgi:hypothetical protein
MAMRDRCLRTVAVVRAALRMAMVRAATQHQVQGDGGSSDQGDDGTHSDANASILQSHRLSVNAKLLAQIEDRAGRIYRECRTVAVVVPSRIGDEFVQVGAWRSPRLVSKSHLSAIRLTSVGLTFGTCKCAQFAGKMRDL